MQEFDLVVVGSGSGQNVAYKAVSMGLDVALVEVGPIGGTCLNRGCIPSKMLIHRADVAQTVRNAERFGVKSVIEDIDFAEIVGEVNNEVERDSKSVEEGIRRSEKETLFQEEARFVGEKTLRTGSGEIRGDKVVVAAGARPFVPSIKGLRDVDFLTSKEALKLKELPERLVIVGGGYVAAELGHFFDAMGSDVSIIESSDTLVDGEDRDVSERFTEVFRERFNVETGFRAEKVSEVDGEVVVEARSSDGGWIEVEGDKLLVAAGRTPNTDLLDVGKAGIETDGEGFIKVNDFLETSAEDVWALGDVINRFMFKHTANLEARYVYINALTNHRHKMSYEAMPYAVFSDPQIASVGKKERELEEGDVDYLKNVYPYSNVAMGSALKEENGFVKALAKPDGKILGCHVIGPHASILIHEVVVAMRSGEGGIENILDGVHIHPALSEVIVGAFGNL